MKRVLVFFLLSTCTFAQGPSSGGAPLKEPCISLQFEYEHSQPQMYTLSIGADGNARYEVPGSLQDPEEKVTNFRVSDATRDKVFALAQKLRNFDGDFEYKKHRVAFSGWRTFTYKNGAVRHSAKYNWSETPAANEIASLFEGIAATLEAESQLRYLRKHDKLGLNAFLGTLEKRAKSGWVKELPLLSKVLAELSTDPEVMNIARQRAQRLAQSAQAQ
jgi:hypothetical protein